MAFSRAHVALALLCLTMFSSEVSSWSLRGLMSFGSSCLVPISPNQVPEQPGPYDAGSNYMCFGFQFATNYDPTPVLVVLRGWFASIANPAVNPYATLNAQSDDAPVEFFSDNSRYYYPLDGPYGSGTNGTGYGGVPNVKSTYVGKHVYSASFQIQDFTFSNVSYAKVNKALENLGKRLTRFFPTSGSSKRRPAVLDYEITTFFVRQDPRFNGPQNTINVTTEENPAGSLVVKGCKYP